jgi:uncharacterized protein (TIGR03663 family)
MSVSDLPLDSQQGMTKPKEEHRQAEAATPVALPWLTVEVAVYGLLGLLALASRFYALGARPLTAPEAAQALHAWQATAGPGGDALAASPLLFAGQALAFALLGAGDGAARLLPALAGVALVLLPYLLRHRLGRAGALAASALLLISPTVLFTSRDGGGDVLLLTAGLAALVGLIGWVDFRRPAYLYLLAAAAALALTAAPGVYTLIVALAVTVALLVFLGQRALDETWASLLAIWQETRSETAWLRTGVALFFGALVLLPTTLLLRPEGVQAVANLFPAWINHFAPWAGDQSWSYPLAVLILYEPLLLLFGLIGAVVACLEQELLGRLLTVWTGVALLVALIVGGRGPGDVLLVVGPLALLAGRAVGRLLEKVAGRDQWIQNGLIAGLLTAIGAFCYVQLAAYTQRHETDLLWLAALSLSLFAGMFALYTVWFGRQTGWQGGGLTLLILLSLVTISFGDNLAYHRSDDPRELLVVEGTSPNVRDLPALLAKTSMQRLGATEVIPITADEAVGPVVRWYLRDLRNQTWLDSAPGPEVTTEAVVTPWKPYAPELGADYFGEDFVVRTTWQLRTLTRDDWANWLLFRKSPDRPQQERVVLWLKRQGGG